MPAAGAVDSGRYQIGRLLGRGGLGEVYLAHDRMLGRDVAIKFVNPDKVADASARRALLREARAAAALDHPYICTVYETGETPDGRGFIVMQYVEGETLSTVLAQGAMSVRDALGLCADIADALGAAHRRGVIHRDLKPGNIMVTPSGRPKLVDFGIAKVTLERAQPPDESTLTGGTLDDVLVGTPAYMSPEQVQKLPLDGRSDLFALGLVLFECLTGRRAFRAPTALATFANILQVHPPPPSSMRVGLTDAHDELCRRLLAKEPADRFQSAEEVVGALRVLLPDTSRTPAPEFSWLPPAVGRWNKPIVAWVAAALAVAGIAAGAAIWNRGSGLPAVPEVSDVWYRRGSEALREGGYHSARKALEQAVQIFPQHALAYARLAEADAELDDPQSAQSNLLRVSAIVPDESRLPDNERLRLQAVRALVLRDEDRAIALYRELTANSEEAGSIVDLGRAYEAAGRITEARDVYTQAIARDSQYAAAYLRLGSIEAAASRQAEATAAFSEAERLYRAQSRAEGETEVLLRRGAALDARGQLGGARQDLERALLLATNEKSIHQRIRATLSLSSVTASEGRYAESERMTSEAIKEALANRLETLAAIGLIDLTATLMDLREFMKAEERALKAIELAEGRGATQTVARAKVQLAEVYFQTERERQALTTLSGVLPFLRENRFRRIELTGLLIAARARLALDELEQARRDSTELLKMADAMQNEALAATAAITLATVTTALGDFPAALRLRERAEAIHRRLGDGSLPYDLANRADLLIRLGRPAEAQKLFIEIDAGIAAGIDSYIGRQRRATFLRAFEAVIALRCRDALPLLDTVQRAAVVDVSARLAPPLRAFCEARIGVARSRAFPAPPPSGADPATVREQQYWMALAALQRRDGKAAAAAAATALKLLGDVPNDEMRWRLAAVAAAAARTLGDTATAGQMSELTRVSYDRLRTAFKDDLTTYERRPDLAELKNKEQ